MARSSTAFPYARRRWPTETWCGWAAARWCFLSVEEEADASTIEFGEELGHDRLKTILLHEESASPQFGTDIARMARDLNALFKIAKTINSIQDLKALQSHLLQLIFEVVPAESGAILLINHLDEEPASISTWDRTLGEGRHVRVQRELIGRAIWERSAVLGEPTDDSSEAENILCVPLVALQKTIGVIYLISSRPSQRFEEDHVHFLSSVAGVAAVTLENVLSLEALRDENRRLRQELSPKDTIIGESKLMRQLMGMIAKVAQGDSTVLIRGESGTGKELVALRHPPQQRARREAVCRDQLRRHSRDPAGERAVRPREGRVHRRGRHQTRQAGSRRGRHGLSRRNWRAGSPPCRPSCCACCRRGSLSGWAARMPSSSTRRVVTATNKNLEQAIKAGEFRQDLFYRLNVVSVTVPPLRDHREDIPLLAIYFATRFAQRCTHAFRGISAEARSLLMNYSWPGNVRELENAIEHAIVLGSGTEILPEDLPEALLEGRPATRSDAKYHDAINQLKRELILGGDERGEGELHRCLEAAGRPRQLSAPADQESEPEIGVAPRDRRVGGDLEGGFTRR